MKEFLGIIPARYQSTRFPGKPLALLGNKPMIQWVYERASRLFDHLVVATDDARIKSAVESFGGQVLITSASHRTGTERCAEALGLMEEQSGTGFRFVVNIQGDEPLIDPGQLKLLTGFMTVNKAPVSTLIRPIENEEELSNPNVVKVVVDRFARALYFSRSPIPYVRERGADGSGAGTTFHAHVGLYGFTAEALKEVVTLPPSPLELAESLEQLRWMEAGISIHTVLTHTSSAGVDTPEDLKSLRKRI